MDNEEIKFETVDKLILFAIILTIILTIIGTVVVVKYRYNKNPNLEINGHSLIENNSVYQYEINTNKVDFYHGNGLVANYVCKTNCSIPYYHDDQFIIKNDSLIPIVDNNSFLIFDINSKDVFLTLDNYPKKSYINDLGIISVDGLFAIINSKGKMLSEFYDNIDITNNYILTLKNKKLNIYDKKMNNLTANSEIDDVIAFVVKEENNNIYVYTTNSLGVSSSHQFDILNKVYIN